MTLELWTLGKSKARWLRDGIAEYTARLPHLVPFTYVEWDGPRLPRKPSPEQVLAAEAAYVLDKLRPRDRLHLFDERGKSYTSRKFAAHLERLQHTGGTRLVFLVGGAYGFGESLYARAQGKVSLSGMTFSHQLVRLLVAEQLYRAYTILRGLPYHND